MDRRNFLKASTLTAGVALLPNVLAQADTAQAQNLRMMPMNRGWRFSPKVVEGDTNREFDDTAFMRVVIPHTNKVLPWHSFDDKEYEFISTYRRRFKLPRAGLRSAGFCRFRSGHDSFDGLDQRTKTRRI